MNAKAIFRVSSRPSLDGHVDSRHGRDVRDLRVAPHVRRAPSRVTAPKFEVDPAWPHIPNGWTLGQVSSAATDAAGNTSILFIARAR